MYVILICISVHLLLMIIYYEFITGESQNCDVDVRVGRSFVVCYFNEIK